MDLLSLRFINKNITASLKSALIIFLICYVSYYKLWLASVIPTGVSQFLPHDGTLFYKVAVNLFNGQWLGEYNQYTLIKGVGFPAYIATCAKLGLNPKVTSHILYLLSCLVFYKALRTLHFNRFISLTGFVLLALNPVTLSRMWLGLTRQHLYMPMIVLILSALIVISFSIVHKKALKDYLVWCISCSVALAIALNTREEGIWIYATLIPLIALSLIYSARHKSTTPLFVLALIASLPILANQYIKSKNEQFYGLPITNEMKEHNYSRAWDAVLSLNTKASYYRPDEKIINEEIHLNAETIEKMQLISPLTKELINQAIDPNTGYFYIFHNSINGTYGLWLLRDMMDLAGYYKNAKTASNTYAQLADDIQAYCQKDTTNCNPVIISKVQLKQGHWAKLFPTINYVVNFAAFFPEVFLLKEKELQYLKGSPEFDVESGYFLSAFPKFIQGHALLDRNKSDVIAIIEQKKLKIWRRLKSNFKHYNLYFPYLLISSLIMLIFVAFRAWRQNDKVAIIATLIIAFSSICAINIAIALTAYTAVARPVSPATICVLMFCPIMLGYTVELLKKKTKHDQQNH